MAEPSEDFYISYDRADRAWAEWIAWRLDEAQFHVILDSWNFRPGSNFILEMNEALVHAKHIIAVMSPNYTNGMLTKAQWAASFAAGPNNIKGKLIPVIIQECDTEGLLGQIVPIDLLGLDEGTAIRALIAGVKGALGRPKGRPPFPRDIKPVTTHKLGFPAVDSLLEKYVTINGNDNVVSQVFKMCFPGIRGASELISADALHKDFLREAGGKYTNYLEERFNFIRIFGMNQPMPLRGIYTRVNILKKITSTHRVSLRDLEQFFDYDRRNFGVKVGTEDGIKTINVLNKCIVLGKPGAGKTTFLKHITLQSLDGVLDEFRVPIFINLKDWSESNISLNDYILSQFEVCDIPGLNLLVDRLLTSGSCLILLDGLDEVSSNVEDVILQLKNFSSTYNANKIILSCRIAAYNYWFEQFTDVELADFTDEQIQKFIFNWFGTDTKTAESCWRGLLEQTPIKELASIPLLLTLLCLAFDETLYFPRNKAALYKEAIDALLKKWDTSRRITRAEIYRDFSLNRKESMFSQIAATSFEKGEYFLPQRTLEEYITSYLKHLHQVEHGKFEIDSEAILKAIEAQHGIFVERAKGIYSFSHLTFQEYFTAKYLVDNALEGTLHKFAKTHLTDPRWNEVFLIVSGMLPKGDGFILLLKNSIDALVNKQLAEILQSIQNKVLEKESYLKNVQLPLGVARIYITFRAFEHVQRNISLNIARNPALDTIQLFARSACHDLLNILNFKFTDELGKFLDADLNFTFTLNQRTAENFAKYIKANSLLVSCMNSDCYILNTTRKRILDELLSVPSVLSSGPMRLIKNILNFLKQSESVTQ